MNGAAVEGEGEGGSGSSPVKKQEADDEESKASSSYGSSNKGPWSFFIPSSCLSSIDTENEEIPAGQDGEDSKEQGE